MPVDQIHRKERLVQPDIIAPHVWVELGPLAYLLGEAVDNQTNLKTNIILKHITTSEHRNVCTLSFSVEPSDHPNPTLYYSEGLSSMTVEPCLWVQERNYNIAITMYPELLAHLTQALRPMQSPGHWVGSDHHVYTMPEYTDKEGDTSWKVHLYVAEDLQGTNTISLSNRQEEICPFHTLGTLLHDEKSDTVNLLVPGGDLVAYPEGLYMSDTLSIWTASRQLDLRWQFRSGKLQKTLEEAKQEQRSPGIKTGVYMLVITALQDNRFWNYQNETLYQARRKGMQDKGIED